MERTYGGPVHVHGVGNGSSGGQGGAVGGGPGGGRKKPDKEKTTPAIRYDASVYFKEPEHFGDCRICHTLTTEGETRGLFTNHLSNYATGCPSFINMTAERRKSVALKAQFCLRCFHPEVVYSKSHDKECIFASGKKKNAYSCTNMSCREQLWLCLTHKAQNRKAMDKFKQDLTKKGLQLSPHHVHAKIPLLNRAMLRQSDLGQGGQQYKDPVGGAIKKLKRKGNAPSEVIDVLSGETMFMFFGLKGRTRSLDTFIDNGCNSVMRHTCARRTLCNRWGWWSYSPG